MHPRIVGHVVLRNNMAHHTVVNKNPFMFTKNNVSYFRSLRYHPKFPFFIKTGLKGLPPSFIISLLTFLEALQRSAEWLGKNSEHGVSLPWALDKIVNEYISSKTNKNDLKTCFGYKLVNRHYLSSQNTASRNLSY